MLAAYRLQCYEVIAYICSVKMVLRRQRSQAISAVVRRPGQRLESNAHRFGDIIRNVIVRNHTRAQFHVSFTH